MDKEIVSRLSDLLQLDIDAVLAYQQALDACVIFDIRRKLKSFQDDHQQHINDLADLVSADGEQPTFKRDFKGFLIEGFTAVVSRGDRTALLAMLGNEELTTHTYESVLKMELPGEVRAVVARNYADETRHLAWIKGAIQRRLWEIKEGAAAVEDDEKGKKRSAA